MSENYLERVGRINASLAAEREAQAYLTPSSAEATGAWMDDVEPSDPDSQESRLSAPVPLVWLMEQTGVRPTGLAWYETAAAAAVADNSEFAETWQVPPHELLEPTSEDSAAGWSLPDVQQAAMALATRAARYHGVQEPATLEQARIFLNGILVVEQGESSEAWLRSLPSQPFYTSAGNQPPTS